MSKKKLEDLLLEQKCFEVEVNSGIHDADYYWSEAQKIVIPEGQKYLTMDMIKKEQLMIASNHLRMKEVNKP